MCPNVPYVVKKKALCFKKLVFGSPKIFED